MIDYRVTSKITDGTISIQSMIEGNVTNYADEHDPRVGKGHGKHLDTCHISAEKNMALMSMVTKRSGLNMAVAVHHDRQNVL